MSAGVIPTCCRAFLLPPLKTCNSIGFRGGTGAEGGADGGAGRLMDVGGRRTPPHARKARRERGGEGGREEDVALC